MPDESVRVLYETVVHLRAQNREEAAGLVAAAWLHSSWAGTIALQEIVAPGVSPVAQALRYQPVDPGFLQEAQNLLAELSEERGGQQGPPGGEIVHELARALQLITVSRITDEIFGHTRSVLLRVAETSADPRTLRDAWSALGMLYVLGDRMHGDLRFVESCIESLRRAVAPEPLSPSDPGASPRDLDSLGTALFEKFKLTTDVRLAEESAHFHSLALERVREPYRNSVLDNYGASLYYVAEATRDPDTLQRSIISYREAITAAADDHARKRVLRAKYLRVLSLVPKVCSSGSELDCAIAEVRQLAGHCTDAEEACTVSHSLAGLLAFRFTTGQQLGDLNEAVEQLCMALSASSAERQTWGNINNDLGAALAQRFDRTQDLKDLEEAVGYFSEAERHLPQGLRSTVRHNLRVARSRLARARQDPQGQRPENCKLSDAETVIATSARLALEFQYNGDLSCIERAIEVATEAIRVSPHFELHRLLAELWRERAAVTGEEADLQTALHHAHEAVAAASLAQASPSSRDLCEETLGDLLRIRYEQNGDLGDLDAAISYLSDGPLRDPADNPPLSRSNRLGLALTRRYEHNRDLADLQTAIDRLSVAVDSADENDLALPSLVNNLASAYHARFHRLGAPDDLDIAIEQHRRAVQLGPHNAPQHGTRLSNLAKSLQTRYELHQEQNDLKEAISVSQQALQATRPSDTERTRRLNTHATLLFERYLTTRAPKDLELSLAQGWLALSCGFTSQAHRAEFLAAQARRLLLGRTPTGTGGSGAGDGFDAYPAEIRAAFNALQGTGATAFYEQAIALYDQARRLESALIHDRCRAARSWAQLAALRDVNEGISGAYVAFDLLAGVDWSGMQISDRLSLLHEWSEFPSTAAAWAIGSDRPLDAVRLLEHGRGHLWAQITGTHTQFTSSGPSVRRISDQLDKVHAELNQLAAPASTRPSRDDARRGARLFHLNKERRRLISQLRSNDDFEDFLAPPTDVHMQAALGAGPVVMLNISSSRCDALLLRDTNGALRVDVIPLRTLRKADVEQQVEVFEAARRTARIQRARIRADRHAGVLSRRSVRAGLLSATEEIRELLAWGWDEITGPVLQELGYESTPQAAEEWPRVWWCPTGPLTRLPLQATGYHDGSNQAVIDRVASSDATTVRALADAYRRRSGTGSQRMLCVGVPQLRDQERGLIAVPVETDAVTELTPWAVTRLAGGAATKSAILDRLAEHSCFHFAGHGATSIKDPSETALSAFDAPLTLADIATTLQGDAEIAFLSSCHGTDPSRAHPEDAVHLAAAFHTLGFRHSIAARHQVDDQIALQVATGFYQRLRVGGDPGLALHHTVRELRAVLADKRTRDELTDPHAWISHTHMGPASTSTSYISHQPTS